VWLFIALCYIQYAGLSVVVYFVLHSVRRFKCGCLLYCVTLSMEILVWLFIVLCYIEYGDIGVVVYCATLNT
jgi:hypothetical protein